MNKQKLINDIFQGVLVAGLVAFVMPELALAQQGAGTDLGTAASDVTSKELNPLNTLISAAFYIGGGVMMGSGALKLKDHAEQPQQNPIKHGVSRLAVGAALMGIPYFSHLAIDTLNYGSTNTNFTTFGNIQNGSAP